MSLSVLQALQYIVAGEELCTWTMKEDQL